MYQGILENKGRLYYLKESGVLQDTPGWLCDDYGNWYYVSNTAGELHTGWLYVGGAWYYLDPNSGRMYQNETRMIDGQYSRFTTSGAWAGYVN